MAAARVTHALCISVNLPDWPGVHALALAHPNLYATVGVHPDYEDTPEPSQSTTSSTPRRMPKVVAIGETGLDYYRQRRRSRMAARALSHAHPGGAARAQAARHPHARGGGGHARDHARGGRRRRGGVMHCFTETWDVARAALDLGFHISFSGIVTFKNAKDLKEVARRVPLDRMLIETDSPYLAPVPYRGKRNEPAYVAHVAAEIARLRDVPRRRRWRGRRSRISSGSFTSNLWPLPMIHDSRRNVRRRFLRAIPMLAALVAVGGRRAAGERGSRDRRRPTTASADVTPDARARNRVPTRSTRTATRSLVIAARAAMRATRRRPARGPRSRQREDALRRHRADGRRRSTDALDIVRKLRNAGADVDAAWLDRADLRGDRRPRRGRPLPAGARAPTSTRSRRTERPR